MPASVDINVDRRAARRGARVSRYQGRLKDSALGRPRQSISGPAGTSTPVRDFGGPDAPKSRLARSRLCCRQTSRRLSSVESPPRAKGVRWSSSRNLRSLQRFPFVSVTVHCPPSRSHTSRRIFAGTWREFVRFALAVRSLGVGRMFLESLGTSVGSSLGSRRSGPPMHAAASLDGSCCSWCSRHRGESLNSSCSRNASRCVTGAFRSSLHCRVSTGSGSCWRAPWRGVGRAS